MKRNIYFSAVVFLFPFVLVCAAWLTQLAMGVVRSDDAPIVIFSAFFLSAVLAAAFYFILKEVNKRFAKKSEVANYTPTNRFYSFSIVVVGLSLIWGVTQGYTVGSRQLKLDVLKKDVEGQRMQRIAAMSPEQLAEEKRIKDVLAKTVALAAAQKERNIEACRDKVVNAVRTLGYKPNADSGNLFRNSFSRFQESGYSINAAGVAYYSMGVEADYSSTGELTWFICEVSKDGIATVKLR